MKFDFEDGNGPVPAHRHPNGGGWVADTASVNPASFVEENAQVFGKALLLGEVKVKDNAKVFGNANIYDEVMIVDQAQVYGNAMLLGSVMVGDNAQVFGDVELGGEGIVCDNAKVFGTTFARGNFDISDNAKVSGNTNLRHHVKICGNAVVVNGGPFNGNIVICGDALITNSNVFAVSRSDGYTFALLPCNDGIYRITAGCRYFTLDEARKHWDPVNYSNAKLAKETQGILDYLEMRAHELDFV